MRIKNSIKNLLVAWGGQIILLLLGFVSRSVFLHYLNSEYLGVNGLFSNILSMLSLAELGIGTAIIYSLYKPIAENDEKEIQAIMRFYKYAYTAIGVFVGVVGSALTPFLDVFIKERPNIPYLEIIYLLFVWNSAISYFYAYKVSFVNANQKNYVTSLCNTITRIIAYIVQMLILVVTKNFILYVGVQIVITLLNNIVISYIANKMYPILKRKEKEKLKKETLHDIMKNTGAMIFHQVGSIVVFSTDNLILSKLVGIVSVGIYSNYSMLVNNVNSLMGQVFSAITASVGNLGVTETKEKKHDVFMVTFFVGFWMYSFATICFFCLFNPFIEIWLGSQYLFTMNIVFVICLNFYLTGMRKAVLTFKSAFGLYWQDRYKPIFEVIVNLIFSIILTIKFGIIGVFVGTTISTVATVLWIEPCVLYKYGFDMPVKNYFKRFFSYSIVAFLEMFVTYQITSFVMIEGIIGFIIKVVACIVIPNAINLIIFCRCKEFKEILNIVKRLRKR